jgi:hypothetical protein
MASGLSGPPVRTAILRGALNMRSPGGLGDYEVMKVTGNQNVSVGDRLPAHDLTGPPFLGLRCGVTSTSAELVSVSESDVHA